MAGSRIGGAVAAAVCGKRLFCTLRRLSVSPSLPRPQSLSPSLPLSRRFRSALARWLLLYPMWPHCTALQRRLPNSIVIVPQPNPRPFALVDSFVLCPHLRSSDRFRRSFFIRRCACIPVLGYNNAIESFNICVIQPGAERKDSDRLSERVETNLAFREGPHPLSQVIHGFPEHGLEVFPPIPRGNCPVEPSRGRGGIE